MLELGYGGGLRVSEWIGISVNDLMLDEGVVRVAERVAAGDLAEPVTQQGPRELRRLQRQLREAEAELRNLRNLRIVHLGSAWNTISGMSAGRRPTLRSTSRK